VVNEVPDFQVRGARELRCSLGAASTLVASRSAHPAVSVQKQFTIAPNGLKWLDRARTYRADHLGAGLVLDAAVEAEHDGFLRLDRDTADDAARQVSAHGRDFRADAASFQGDTSGGSTEETRLPETSRSRRFPRGRLKLDERRQAFAGGGISQRSAVVRQHEDLAAAHTAATEIKVREDMLYTRCMDDAVLHRLPVERVQRGCQQSDNRTPAAVVDLS
jgi:hypothetical protein